jgi:hypothetical protein
VDKHHFKATELQRLFAVIRLLSILALLWCFSAQSSTFYLSTTGNDANPGTEAQPFASLVTAIGAVNAGDTLYIRGGRYTGATNMVMLENVTGKSSASLITTIRNYPGELPVFENPIMNLVDFKTTVFHTEKLTNWVFNGLMFSNVMRSMLIEDGRSNVVVNCIFTGMDTNDNWYAGVNVWGESQFNRIIFNTFTNWGHFSTNNDCVIKGTHLYLGNEANDDHTWFNLVASNDFTMGAHDLLQIDSGYNVVRGNRFRNEPWMPTNSTCNTLPFGTEINMYGSYGARHMKPGDTGIDLPTNLQVDQRNVIEDNVFAYSGPPGDGSRAGMALEIASQFGIYRRNQMLYHIASGVYFSSSAGQGLVRSNAVYNNTFYRNGLSGKFGGIEFTNYQWDVTVQSINQRSNILQNNLHWGGWRGAHSPDVAGTQLVGTNWTGSTDPQFINTNGADLSTVQTFIASARSWLLPDLRINTNSPCVDVGGWLAVATNDGSGTTLPLSTTLPFSDGNRIVAGDTIQLQWSTNTATVLSNDWENAVLYLDSSLSWTNGQGVSLPYSGFAPDIGYFESDGIGAEPPAAQTASPTFSPVNGTVFTNSVSVTIASATPGASVWYSTSGTATTNSTPYTGALTLSSTTTISAIAAASGYTASATVSATFTKYSDPEPGPPAASGSFSVDDLQLNRIIRR